MNQGQENVGEHAAMIISDDENEIGEDLYADVNIPTKVVAATPPVVPSSEVLAALIEKLSSQTV